jgi:hypothetical protein
MPEQSGVVVAMIPATSLEAELQRLTQNDDNQLAFQRLARRSITTTEERRGKQPQAAAWATLHAYLARVDCDEDYSSTLHAERLRFAQAAFRRLIQRDGLSYALIDPHRLTLVRRFDPTAEQG